MLKNSLCYLFNPSKKTAIIPILQRTKIRFREQVNIFSKITQLIVANSWFHCRQSDSSIRAVYYYASILSRQVAISSAPFYFGNTSQKYSFVFATFPLKKTLYNRKRSILLVWRTMFTFESYLLCDIGQKQLVCFFICK